VVFKAGLRDVAQGSKPRVLSQAGKERREFNRARGGCDNGHERCLGKAACDDDRHLIIPCRDEISALQIKSGVVGHWPYNRSRIWATAARPHYEEFLSVAAGGDLWAQCLKGRVRAGGSIDAFDCAAIIAGLPNHLRELELVNKRWDGGLGTGRGAGCNGQNE
jgi:hypothetical protein